MGRGRFIGKYMEDPVGDRRRKTSDPLPSLAQRDGIILGSGPGSTCDAGRRMDRASTSTYARSMQVIVLAWVTYTLRWR